MTAIGLRRGVTRSELAAGIAVTIGPEAAATIRASTRMTNKRRRRKPFKSRLALSDGDMRDLARIVQQFKPKEKPMPAPHTTTPALLTELDRALIAIETADRERDHGKAHAIEDDIIRRVLAAAVQRKTNHRVMLARLLAHLERVEKYGKPRWAA